MSVVNPSKTTFSFPPPTASRETFTLSAEEELRIVSQTVQTIREAASRKKLAIKDLFQDFDRHNQGTISGPQFSRVFSVANLHPSPSAMESMCRYYSINGDTTRVNYRRFLTDFDPQSVNVSNRTTSSNLDVIAPSSIDRQQVEPLARTTQKPINIDNIIRKIQTIVAQKRPLLEDLFVDFDPLKKLRVTVPQFRRCLDKAVILLSDDEFDVLASTFIYADDYNQINYPAFVRCVDGAFTPLNIEKSPTMEMSHFVPWTVEESEHTTFSEKEKQRANELLSQIGSAIFSRRILLKPAFQHFDRSRHGIISFRSFTSVLTNNIPISFSSIDLDLLCTLYRRGQEGINYDLFCVDVNAIERRLATTAVQSRENGPIHAPLPIPTRTTHQLTTNLPSISSLLTEIRQKVTQLRIHIDDVFQDFDTLKKGRVTRDQFTRCLSMRSINLSSSQAQLLCSAYAADLQATNVDYIKFIADVEQAEQF